jgi:GNAT superfamily N-acetyltransferase
MTPSAFGKPAVLRCSRCGAFIDWADARAQVVCECRPRLELPPVLVREAADSEREAALDLFRRDFGRSGIVAFGEVMDLDASPAIVAEMNGEIAGALAYRLVEAGLHIVALATDPMWQRSGVGGYLVAEAELLARRLKIGRVIASTTNDNLPSLYFYQRRGYVVSQWIPEGASKHSKSASRLGFGGIPIRDEVRLEKTLEPSRRPT